jgi:NUMOD3 motif
MVNSLKLMDTDLASMKQNGVYRAQMVERMAVPLGATLDGETKKGPNNPMFGRQLDDITKAKLSAGEDGELKRRVLMHKSFSVISHQG